MNSRTSRHRAWGADVVILGLALLVLANPASAQPVEVPATWGGDFWDRPRLTGSWFGLRDEMGKKGVVLDLDLTQVSQGVVSGGRDNLWKYGGLAEYTLNADTQKMGLWPGGFFKAQGMTNYGKYVNQASGALTPPTLTSILPQGENSTGLMNLSFMQFFSPKFGLVLGKLSGLGGDDNAFAHDYHSQFLNTGLNLNMALALFPFTSYGGGLVVLPWEGAVLTASALGPKGTAENDSVSNAFKDGVLVASEGRVTIKPFGLVGHQLLGFGWANNGRLSLIQDPSNCARLLLTEQFPRLGDPGPILFRILKRFFPGLLVPTQPLNTVNSTWTIYYNFDQYLWSPAGHPDRGIGIFARFGISDGVANPVRSAFNIGLGGKGVVPGRPSDTFGVGWSHIELSGNFVPFLRQRLNLGLNREDAIEMYYNASLMPWLGAAMDLQIIDPALKKTLDSSGQLKNMNTALVLGFRLYTRF